MERRVGEEIEAAAKRLAEAGVESPLLDAQLLMAEALGCSRLDVVAHPEREPSSEQSGAFHSMLDRRTARYPFAYLLGRKEFFGLELALTPDVLVPRPETEVLVEECLKRLLARDCSLFPVPCSLTVADLGVGSGAIAIAVAANLPSARIYATEISPEAAKVAGANIEKHQLADRVTILEGDLVEPLAGLGIEFDAVLSNPPYIPSAEIGELEPEVRFEPIGALDGGPDGLDAYRRLFPEARTLLREGGFAAVEVGAGQAGRVSDIALVSGYGRVETARDLAGIMRVVIASK
ncbi:MAG: peptide chain release factor N(5)-glutamine methyltransferase [Armatimonadetes bacterium]|nr:peptide chain release factor N(5)-glutamine methyltransferase [Armatimonadota bacterium]